MNAFLEHNASFVMFSGEHLVVLAVVIMLTVALPAFVVQRQGSRSRRRMGRALSVVIAAVVFTWTGVALWTGVYDWREDLPIHLCYLLALILPLFAWKPVLRTHEVLYYLVLSGTLQALLTPRLTESFPHFDFLYYWGVHGGLLIYVVYATAAHRLWPTMRGLLRSMLWINLYAVPVYGINLLLGTNYFYLRAKPESASLLDFLGPWPWYILAAEGVALVLFWISYLPIAYLKRRK